VRRLRALDDAGRLRIAEALVLVGLLAGVALSWPLWRTAREFPVIAPLGVGAPPAPWDLLGPIALVGGALAALARPSARWARGALLAVLAGLVAIDQCRWQPWVIQYGAMLLVAALAPPREPAGGVLATWRIALASIYLWSGIHKINVNYAEDVHPWLVEPFPAALGLDAAVVRHGAPLIEAAVGFGLLWRRTRAPAAIAAIGMHGFVLAALGPLGHDVNRVVWPWNLTMVGLLVVLAVSAPAPASAAPVRPRPAALHAAAIAWFAALPALNLVERWDAYPAWSLYSGMGASGTIYVDERLIPRLPPAARGQITEAGVGAGALDVFGWATDALGVPDYPEERFHRAVLEALCPLETEPGQLSLAISTARRLRPPRIEAYGCADGRAVLTTPWAGE
jgi:uncharacterized membrane protein YphA (DoxX/SURF4 family)